MDLTCRRRLYAVPHGLLAVGVGFRLCTLQRIAEHGAHYGVWIAMGLAYVAALAFFAAALGIISAAPGLYQVTGSLYVAVWLLVVFEQRAAPLDQQLAPAFVLGGVAAGQLAHWFVNRSAERAAPGGGEVTA